MKVKILVDAESVLVELAEIRLLDQQVAFDIAEPLERAKKALIRFHNEHNALIQDYGKPTGEKGEYFVEDLPEFTKARNMLMEVEINLEFPRLTLSELKPFEPRIKDITQLKNVGLL